jgi:preprotein translocase subunit SecF
MEVSIENYMKNPLVLYFLGAILILLIYIVFIKKKMREAFDIDDSTNVNAKEDSVEVQDSETIATDLKTKATKIEDGLHLDKYRSQMENLIIDMNDWISAKTAAAIPGIAKKINESDGSDIGEIVGLMRKYNEMDNYKKTLNTTMKYIDGK